MSQDTRKDKRAKVVSLNVRYKSATVDEFIENHSHDVSKGGLFVKTPTPFPPGTLLKFEIRLAGDKSVISGVGRVVWKREPTQAAAEKPAGMGVKFIKIDESSRVIIDRLISQKADAGSAYTSEPAMDDAVPVAGHPSTLRGLVAAAPSEPGPPPGPSPVTAPSPSAPAPGAGLKMPVPPPPAAAPPAAAPPVAAPSSSPKLPTAAPKIPPSSPKIPPSSPRIPPAATSSKPAPRPLGPPAPVANKPATMLGVGPAGRDASSATTALGVGPTPTVVLGGSSTGTAPGVGAPPAASAASAAPVPEKPPSEPKLGGAPPPPRPAPPPRKATMMGMGIASTPPPPGASLPPPTPPPPAAGTPARPPITREPITREPPSVVAKEKTAEPMFPRLDPDSGTEPARDQTVMKQAAELLEEALKEAGGSLEEIGQNPLFTSRGEATAATPSQRPGEVSAAQSGDTMIMASPLTAGRPGSTPPPSLASAAEASSVRGTSPSQPLIIDPPSRSLSLPPASTGTPLRRALSEDLAPPQKKGGGGGIIAVVVLLLLVGGGVAAWKTGMLASVIGPDQPAPSATTPPAPPSSTASSGAMGSASGSSMGGSPSMMTDASTMASDAGAAMTDAGATGTSEPPSGKPAATVTTAAPPPPKPPPPRPRPPPPKPPPTATATATADPTSDPAPTPTPTPPPTAAPTTAPSVETAP